MVLNYLLDKYRCFSTLILQKHLSKAGTYYFYRDLLLKVDQDSKILDVGCGDGIYFTNPNVARIIKQKNLNIHCIDLDKLYYSAGHLEFPKFGSECSQS